MATVVLSWTEFSLAEAHGLSSSINPDKVHLFELTHTCMTMCNTMTMTIINYCPSFMDGALTKLLKLVLSWL